MNRTRADLDDESLFDREDAKERRAEREAARERAVEQERQHQELDARASARAAQFTREATERAILAEYARLGVEPRPGPLVSLALLRQLGWTVEAVDGVNTLVAPPPVVLPPRRERDNT